LDPKPNADDGSMNHPAENSELSQPPAEPTSVRGWLRENAISLVTVVVLGTLVCYYLNPITVLLVVFGLGGIIFLHELGHFLAAKACDVHVTTFSIGFGPALPFCSFTYGETRYKLGLVPLGGFVAMVGEGEPGTVEGQEAKEDPRSFKNKPVLQRMFVISAGVIMNLILGAVCFIAAYMNGVEEQPAIVASVDPGSAAWRAGIRPGERMLKLNDMDNLWFDDIRPTVSGTSKGEHVALDTEYRGVAHTYSIEPLRMEGALFPQLGVAGPSSVTLFHMRGDHTPPYIPGTPAANAKSKAINGSGFLPGDTILGTSDPADPSKITPLDITKSGFATANLEFQNRLLRLAGKPVEVQVHRKSGGDSVSITLPAAFRNDTGLRMSMGPIAAIRTGSSAEAVGIQPGDKITKVELPEPTGGPTLLSADSKDLPKGPTGTVKPLDPLRLPFEMNAWADRWSKQPSPNRNVKMTVLREIDHTPKEVNLELTWDDAYHEHFGSLSNAGSPVPLGGLGLAYQVLSTVDNVVPGSAAHSAKVQPGDKVKEIRVKIVDKDGQEKDGVALPVGEHHWGMVDYTLQSQPPHKVELKIDRGGQEVKVTLDATPDTTWPVPADGMVFMKDLQTQKADSVGSALQMGARRTLRAIKSTYQGLYGMIFGRISVKLISGPITLARASYILAGENIWRLVLLLAIISINLAVVNFLPIPVLDGGHMVFLIYEWIRRKPPPVILHNVLTIIGLAMVLCMMLFAVGLDIWRLIMQKL